MKSFNLQLDKFSFEFDFVDSIFIGLQRHIRLISIFIGGRLCISGKFVPSDWWTWKEWSIGFNGPTLEMSPSHSPTSINNAVCHADSCSSSRKRRNCHFDSKTLTSKDFLMIIHLRLYALIKRMVSSTFLFIFI